MNSTRILYEKKDQVAKITLNRPEVLNCADLQTLLDLNSAFDNVESDQDIKVAVLRGAGKVFCSGADLKYIASCDPNQRVRFIRKYHDTINRMESLSKPIIGAIHGVCLAGGLELALGCDILIADEQAQIGDHHANIGAIPGGGSEQRLARIIGVKRALELVLTGKWLTAQEAERVGLVNRVAPAGKLNEAVDEMTKLLTNKDTSVMRDVKYLINYGAQADLHTGLEMEIRTVLYRFAQPEASRGMEAFVDKEKAPYWEKRQFEKKPAS